MFRRNPSSLLFVLGLFGFSTCVSAQDTRDASLIALARSAVVAEVTGAPNTRSRSIGESPSGVFVTIETQGRIVGCRGTLTPRCETLGEEIVTAARSAAGHDPRYTPLSPRDLKDFLVTVTIVERLEPMDAAQIESLKPGDGLVLLCGNRTGIVLPWEGKDPRTRLSWAYQKAGVPESAYCALRRMTARRFRG